MSVTLFSIVFLVSMGGMMAFLIINWPKLPVVKAGKVTKECDAEKRILRSMPDSVVENGKVIDLSGYEKMLVSGNSMKDWGIVDGQRIYVKKLDGNQKLRINSYPVLVFNIIDNPIPGDARYKLRKFVGYIDSVKTMSSEAYSKYRSRIRVPEDIFSTQYEKKIKKIIDNGCDEQLALSETYDEDNDQIVYSLHPVSSIYGEVEYAV